MNLRTHGVIGTSIVLLCTCAVGTAQAGQEQMVHRQGATTTQDARPGGASPLWIQQPYLFKKDGRYYVKGSVLPDLHRVKTRGSTKRDKLVVRVRVAKTGQVSAKKRRDVGLMPVGLLAGTASQRLSPKRGPVSVFTIKLPKKASRQLAKVGRVKRTAAVSVVLEHRKDTAKRPQWALIQMVPGPLASGKDSAKRIKQRTKSARIKIRRTHNPRARLSGSQLAGTLGAEPWYNQIVVSNGSPFVQQVNVNPNIQCMWTGQTPNANVSVSAETVYPGAQLVVNLPYWSADSQQPGLAGATDGMNAPGTQGTLLQDLAQAGVAAGQTALGALSDPETYSEAGAIETAGGIGLQFVATVLEDMWKGTSSCNEVSTYPELFGVSTTVTGFGYNGASDATQGVYPAPVSWTQTSAGQQYSTIAGAGGQQAPSQTWLENNFDSMLGTQTNVTYYWNGGQAAPMVSNNATSAAPYIGGAASYQGGLFQFVGPNPGVSSTVSYWSSSGANPKYSSQIWSSTYENCLLYGDNTSDQHYGCSMVDGVVPIQIGMLNNPVSNGGLWIDGSPTVSASGNSSDGYTLQCQIPDTMEATFQVPFAVNGNTPELQGPALTNAKINTAGAQPSDGFYTVNYFAMTGETTSNGTTQPGEFVYYGPSLTSVNPAGMYQPYLAPNAAQAQVSLNNENLPQGTVSPEVLQNLVTWAGPGYAPEPVSASDVAYFGCNVTASVNLQGLDITDPSSYFGTSWPMPNGSEGGWPAGLPSYTYNFSWMTPVTHLNTTWQSLPVGAVQPISAASTGSG